jgi:hypothetical protein
MVNNFRNLLSPLRKPFINYISNLIKFIRKKDDDDNHFNNPFVIY